MTDCVFIIPLKKRQRVAWMERSAIQKGRREERQDSRIPLRFIRATVLVSDCFVTVPDFPVDLPLHLTVVSDSTAP